MTRVMLGAAGLLLLALGVAAWSAKYYYDQAAEYRQEARTERAARQAAQAHADELQKLMQRAEDARRSAMRAETRARERAETLSHELREAREHASQAYQECMDVPVPDAVADRLRGPDGN